MRKFVVAGLCLALTLLMGFVRPATATPPPVRSISVTGTGAAQYPAFDSSVARYALTTTEATAGTVTVDASTSDPAGEVLVDGEPASGATEVTGLTAGDEVSVIIDDSAGRTTYSVIYLPAGFPRISTTSYAEGVADGYVGLTLNTFEQNPLPAYDAIIDRNGVPVYAVPAAPSDLDLKEQPDGEITVSRLTQSSGSTGYDLVTLDSQLAEGTRRHVLGSLTNTDGHDSVRMTDGSTLLVGYEPNAATGLIDATIQKISPTGTPVFTWTSAAIANETTAANPGQAIPADYAHINSVWPAANGDVIASFRHLSVVLRIATVSHDGYQPGDIVWRLGGRHSDFTFVDDPFPGGPCAQHSATELPDGHILLYDNGSNGFCIDPADPTGPTIDRGVTRVSEYALDTGAGTATLVWSYAPPDTYAWFAGSARRLGNGDTLIGWADDREILATEIDAAKQVLWEATTPDAEPGHRKYITYRAMLIAHLPDAIKPTVTVTGPPDNASFLVGSVVSGSAACTDRGGSNLQSCVVSGLTDGRLDTATPGTRTWTATATDGNGNTRSVLRHYTVRALVRPDGWIRPFGTTTWTGNNVYGSDQTVHQGVRRTRSVSSYWVIQNDGDLAETMTLSGIGSGAGFLVHYFSGDRDITRAVTSGSYRTAALAPSRTNKVKVVVTATSRATIGGARSVLMRARALSSPTASDLVGTRVTVLK
ncbi:MAG: aryl-sulfate sulfotransferase [Marmoricola sp.]